MVTVSRLPTAVDFSDESDSNEQVLDKTEMARLKRRSRADQDQNQDRDQNQGQDEQPVSSTMSVPTSQRPVAKKRKTASGSGSGLTPEEREKMKRTSERLKKDAQRLPVNEGEPESWSWGLGGLRDLSYLVEVGWGRLDLRGNEMEAGTTNRESRVIFMSTLMLILISVVMSIPIFLFPISPVNLVPHPVLPRLRLLFQTWTRT
jgi:hypothetical protein